MGLKKIDLHTPLPKITWVWEGLAPRGFVSVVAALPGVGKTAILTGLAWQATRPQGELLGRKVESTPVVYVDFDAASGDGRGIRWWIERHKAAYPDGDIDRLMVYEPDKDTYGLGEKELAQLEEVVKQTGAGLVIVDSFLAAFPVDPRRAEQVYAPLRALADLAARTGAAVVVVDHLPKPINGEQAGVRGVLGSIAKTAAARAVHVLVRVPPRDVGGRHVLKWEVQKNTFARIPDPFGVEVIFEPEKVYVVETPLPEGVGNPQKDKAKAVVVNMLSTGEVVTRKALLEKIAQEANVTRRTAERYLDKIVEEMNLSKVYMPGRGAPIGYRWAEASPPEEASPTEEDQDSTSASPEEGWYVLG